MRTRIFAFGVLTLVGVSLAGCGLFRFERREAWRDQVEQMCLQQHQVQQTAYMSLTGKSIDGPGACGMQSPFRVSALAEGSVGLKQKLTLACPIIPTIDGWLDDVVKPAALLYFGVPVVDLNAGSYSCRGRNNRSGAKLSEHSFGNALDVMSFILADGRVITVKGGWNGNPVERDFLREVFTGACERFNTVLGPGSDRYHSDHLHLDLARHDPRGVRRFCKPILKFEKKLDPMLVESLKAQSNQFARQQQTPAQPGTAYSSMNGPAPENNADLPYEGDL
ncbi:extensin family protein [Microvirga sp. W0021]|uniref:Extensin family protein n=1 Tax=Hohaiivirga grylli TaxID=3133970 RepID=A0ABV0BJS3_9HYPH